MVLVADDEPAVRHLLLATLPTYGFGVLSAADGSQAVEVYRRHHPGVALMLLDVDMPGLDGPRAFAHLRQIDPGLRCCFMSGFAAEALRRPPVLAGRFGPAHVSVAGMPDVLGVLVTAAAGDSPSSLSFRFNFLWGRLLQVASAAATALQERSWLHFDGTTLAVQVLPREAEPLAAALADVLSEDGWTREDPPDP
jgi:CheY-like chemotaxis protein